MEASTLRRGLLVLFALEEAAAMGGEGWGTNEIARYLGEDKSQISRTLRVLEEMQMVQRDPVTRKYGIGLEMYRLGVRGIDQPLIRASAPILNALVQRLQARTFLVARKGVTAVTIWSADSPKTIQAPNNIGTVYLIARSTTGRALMAASSAEEINDLFDNSPGVFTRREIDEFFAQVTSDRARGYSVGQGSDVGLVNVATPVWGPRKTVRAVIGISGPFNQLRLEPRTVGTTAVAAAAALTRALAAQEPPKRPRPGDVTPSATPPSSPSVR